MKLLTEYQKSDMTPARFVYWTAHSIYDDYKARGAQGQSRISLLLALATTPLFKIHAMAIRIMQGLEIRAFNRRVRRLNARAARV